MRRRDFLGAAAGALAGYRAATLMAQSNATEKLGPIGLQLYTLRGMMQKSVARTLEAVAKAGYQEVEFAGYFNTPVAHLRKMLDDNGLKSPSTHLSMQDTGQMWPIHLENANVLGQKYVTIAWIDAQDRTLDGYKAVADRFNEAGLLARGENLTVAFHNHSYGFEPIQGQVPFDILLRNTDPLNLVIEADVFWMRQAKQDPFSWFAKYPGRFHMLHMKDMGRPPKNAMLDVGKGVIDWKAMIARAKAAGARHFFVEHDEPKDPIASIRSSYRYLRALRYTARA